MERTKEGRFKFLEHKGVDLDNVITYIEDKLKEDRAYMKLTKSITDIENYCNRTNQLLETEIFLLILKKQKDEF